MRSLGAVSVSILCLAMLGCEERGARRTDAGSSSRRDGSPTGSGEIDAATPFSNIDSGTSGCVPGDDADGDGFASGDDCNDCSAQVNPGAFDFPGNGIDEDCDGSDATTAATECDRSLDLGSVNPEDAARAIGLCHFTDASSRQWGVISARFTRADGTGQADAPQQIGLLTSFGAAEATGGALLALSSGVARTPGQPGYTSECDTFGVPDPFFGFPSPPPPHGFPTGYPQPSPACPGVTSGEPYNSIALEVELRIPTNARSFRFRSSFYTYEYPDFICSQYNDYFVVLRENEVGWDNIVFDTMTNPLSVNNGFLAVCSPGNFGGRQFDCPQGRNLLTGTGFDGSASCGTGDLFGGLFGGGGGGGGDIGASTGWLETVAPVSGGQILRLRFAIWDSGDPDLDSTALIDGFEWDLEEVTNAETVPVVI